MHCLLDSCTYWPVKMSMLRLWPWHANNSFCSCLNFETAKTLQQWRCCVWIDFIFFFATYHHSPGGRLIMTSVNLKNNRKLVRRHSLQLSRWVRLYQAYIYDWDDAAGGDLFVSDQRIIGLFSSQSQCWERERELCQQTGQGCIQLQAHVTKKLSHLATHISIGCTARVESFYLAINQLFACRFLDIQTISCQANWSVGFDIIQRGSTVIVFSDEQYNLAIGSTDKRCTLPPPPPPPYLSTRRLTFYAQFGPPDGNNMCPCARVCVCVCLPPPRCNALALYYISIPGLMVC